MEEVGGVQAAALGKRALQADQMPESMVLQEAGHSRVLGTLVQPRQTV